MPTLPHGHFAAHQSKHGKDDQHGPKAQTAQQPGCGYRGGLVPATRVFLELNDVAAAAYRARSDTRICVENLKPRLLLGGLLYILRLRLRCRALVADSLLGIRNGARDLLATGAAVNRI